MNKDDLREVIKEKQETWEINFVDKLPPLGLLKELTIIGKFSFSQAESRRRMIKKSTAVNLGDGVLETPPSIARTYLFNKYKLSPRIGKDQFKAVSCSINPMPNYATPVNFENGYYIDIKSAYWSIMNVCGWDVDYWPGKWLGHGTPPDDFPFADDKITRSCLYSAGASSKGKSGHQVGKIPFYRPVKNIDVFETGNPLMNPSLHKLTSDVLNSIAYQAVKAGAVYANTDGFICPSDLIAGHVLAIITDWGLKGNIKAAGAGGVKGSGAYAVGESISEPYKNRANGQEIKNIYNPRHTKWLEKSFSFWARENSVLY